MRHLIWIAVLIGFAQSMPLAHAQSESGTKGGAYAAGPGGGTPPPGYRADQPNPENCGTPDEPKACPPMPRKALDYYPGPRPGHR